jgi:hypothetical protein
MPAARGGGALFKSQTAVLGLSWEKVFLARFSKRGVVTDENIVSRPDN